MNHIILKFLDTGLNWTYLYKLNENDFHDLISWIVHLINKKMDFSIHNYEILEGEEKNEDS